jgi:hypothetical protein
MKKLGDPNARKRTSPPNGSRRAGMEGFRFVVSGVPRYLVFCPAAFSIWPASIFSSTPGRWLMKAISPPFLMT